MKTLFCKAIFLNLVGIVAYLLAGISPALGQISDDQSISQQHTASGDHVRVRWLAPQTFAQNSTETVGLFFEVDPGWHVYWRNAGDSGAAPKFDFTSEDASIGEVQWPFPQRLPIAHLTNLGYEGDVAYLFEVRSLSSESLSISVALEWLVCKVDCIPGFATMTLSRSLGPRSEWQGQDRLLRDYYQSRVPKKPTNSLSAAITQVNESSLELTITPLNLATKAPPEVFPLNGDFITAAAPLIMETDGTITYQFNRVPGGSLPQATDFVVVENDQAWQLEQVSLASSANETRTIDADKFGQPIDGVALWLLLVSAFVGGVILNLMPCVFPVLSIKVFGMLDASTRSRMREGALYSAGVLTTFGLLGALLLMLRAGGASIGWGFQLQSPWVVLSLILLFWLMALSFSGVFEFGHKLMNLAGNSHGGSFVTGILAVFVAAPCTGPFMGTALGAAAVLPATTAMAIFLSLGAGLAAPFLLLCASPWLMNRLPSPGPWMEKLRQFLAFPLYATVIWLLWVLGRLLGDDGWLLGSLLLLAVAFAFWIFRNLGRFGQFAAPVILLSTLAFTVTSIDIDERNVADSTAGQSQMWKPFDLAIIQQAIANNRGVFIDYTAAWCITCQVNKKLVLESDYVLALFANQNVLLVRADWTNHDPAITESLAQLGRNSVPVYAWYPPGESEPVLLPQILQERMIAELFEQEPLTVNNQ